MFSCPLFVQSVSGTSLYDFCLNHLLQISSRNLDRVRKLKSAMTRLTARVQKVYLLLVLCLSIAVNTF